METITINGKTYQRVPDDPTTDDNCKNCVLLGTKHCKDAECQENEEYYLDYEENPR
jgi:hypothetical protein